MDQTVGGRPSPTPTRTTGTYTVSVTATDEDGGTSAAATETVSIRAAVLEDAPCDPGQQALFVGGTTGDDSIVVSPATGRAVQAQINGASVGTLTSTGRIVVYAGLAPTTCRSRGRSPYRRDSAAAMVATYSSEAPGPTGSSATLTTTS